MNISRLISKVEVQTGALKVDIGSNKTDRYTLTHTHTGTLTHTHTENEIDRQQNSMTI